MGSNARTTTATETGGMGARDGDVMSIAWELHRGFDARDWTAARWGRRANGYRAANDGRRADGCAARGRRRRMRFGRRTRSRRYRDAVELGL